MGGHASVTDDDRETIAASMGQFESVDDAFAVRGRDMRFHVGRSVIGIQVDGRQCYLKRYWLAPSQILKGHVSRGFHELRMIDWLNGHGFSGPRVLACGSSSFLGVSRRLFFLMEEVPGEMPLAQFWWKHPEVGDSLLASLARFSARLHDAGFVHTDYSERHIFVGRRGDDWTFRLIDVERARVGPVDNRAVAADLKTLAASIADQRLRERIAAGFLDDYVAERTTPCERTDMRSLFARASATRSF